VDSWKASFLRAGVYPERKLDPEEDVSHSAVNCNLIHLDVAQCNNTSM